MNTKYIPRILLISLLAIFLNGEYFSHGILFITLIPLLLLYVTYIIFIDNLIRVFNLNEKQLFVVGAFFGLFIETFLNRSIFTPYPLIAGINPISVLVQSLAWGFMATLISFHLGNKIIPRVKTKKSFDYLYLTISSLVILLLFSAWWQSLRALNEKGVTIMGIVFLGLVLIFIYLTLKKKKLPETTNKKIIFKVIYVYLAVELITGTFFLGFAPIIWILSILSSFLVIYLFAWKKHSLTV